MPPPTPVDAPLLALGMNVAPFNVAKRRLVRDSMLRHNSVLSGRIVFRFVVGSFLVPRTSRSVAKAAASDARWRVDQTALAEEIASHGDIVQLDAIDGPGVAMECPTAIGAFLGEFNVFRLVNAKRPLWGLLGHVLEKYV